MIGQRHRQHDDPHDAKHPEPSVLPVPRSRLPHQKSFAADAEENNQPHRQTQRQAGEGCAFELVEASRILTHAKMRKRGDRCARKRLAMAHASKVALRLTGILSPVQNEFSRGCVRVSVFLFSTVARLWLKLDYENLALSLLNRPERAETTFPQKRWVRLFIYLESSRLTLTV
jgi:hypothetical protein